MLNKFLARGEGVGWEVGSSEGWSKGITARREKSWPDSGEKMGNGCHFHPAWGNPED